MIEFKAREPQQNQRGNRQRGYAHACGEVFSGSGNGHKPHLPRREPEGGKHLAARSDQTAEREREVSSTRSTTLRMGPGQGRWRSSFLDQTLNAPRAYSPFAKTFLASRDEDLRPGAMPAAGD